MDSLNKKIIEDTFVNYLKKCPNELIPYAYSHTYSVVSLSLLIASIRNENQLVCGIAALFHDCAKFSNAKFMCDHANESAIICQKLLKPLNIIEQQDLELISKAIKHHSEKGSKHECACVEILKDADLLSSYLYEKRLPIEDNTKIRLKNMLNEIHIPY